MQAGPYMGPAISGSGRIEQAFRDSTSSAYLVARPRVRGLARYRGNAGSGRQGRRYTGTEPGGACDVMAGLIRSRGRSARWHEPIGVIRCLAPGQ
jgi:hypothetical protein